MPTDRVAPGLRRLRLLAVASRPSDYVELLDLVRELARRGHRMTVFYLYAESERAQNVAALEGIESLRASASGIEARAIEILTMTGETSRRRRPTGGAKAPREESWRAKVVVFLNALIVRIGLSLYHNRVSRRMPVVMRRFLANSMFLLAKVFELLLYPRRIPRAVVRLVIPRRLRQPIAAGIEMRRFYRSVLHFFRYSIEQYQIDALLIPEDVVGYVWPVCIKAGHDCGIPTLVFPYTLANRQEPIQSLRDEHAFQSGNNRLAVRLFPRWRYRDDKVDLVRLPADHVYAHELLHITPPDPWMMNSGYANRICVESRASFEYFSDGGIPATKMELTGSVSQDKMFLLKLNKQTSLDALRRELGLQGAKHLLLLSGCPNQLAGKVPYCEFSDFPAIAAFIGESLAPLSNDYHLIVRPHPNFPDFGPMLADYGFISCSVPTSQLVPISDLFIAFASATIRWSIACAIPTVNYDIFHYGYGDFASAAGVLSVQKKNDFRAIARELVPGRALYAEMADKIRSDSERWSMMDGHCLDRIEAAIERECARRPAPRTSE